MGCEAQDTERFWRERMMEIHLQHTREKVDLLEALKARFGEEVVEVVARTASDRARRQWQAIAGKVPGQTIEDLLRVLWEPLGSKGFDFQTESRPDGVQLTCTRCPIADMARTVGNREWLFHLTCGVDAAIAEGFNPDIGFRRTRTIMEGHDRCDHFYFMRSPCQNEGGRDLPKEPTPHEPRRDPPLVP